MKFENPLRSFAFFHEILEGKLFLGAMPTNAAEMQMLLSTGIDSILTVQEEYEYGENLPSMESVLWKRLPIRDWNLGGLPTIDQLETGANLLHDWIDENDRIVYVHCFAGMGRSPLVCLAYLTKWKKMSLEEGLRFLRARRPQASPTLQQLEVLREMLGRKNVNGSPR